MNSQIELTNFLVQSGALRTPEIIAAFYAIDRADFVWKEDRTCAYQDTALSIGQGQTISQPTTVALMLEWLKPQPDNTVLDIGSGSGWTTALLAKIVGDTGSVMGLELVPELLVFGSANLARYHFAHARIQQADVHMLGMPGKLFDKILVSASADAFPNQLLQQLKSPGDLVIPVRDSVKEIHKNTNGAITKIHHPGFLFVPLK